MTSIWLALRDFCAVTEANKVPEHLPIASTTTSRELSPGRAFVCSPRSAFMARTGLTEVEVAIYNEEGASIFLVAERESCRCSVKSRASPYAPIDTMCSGGGGAFPPYRSTCLAPLVRLSLSLLTGVSDGASCILGASLHPYFITPYQAMEKSGGFGAPHETRHIKSWRT